MTGTEKMKSMFSDWFTRILTTFIGLLLVSATLGTFAAAEEFAALKESVNHLDRRVDYLQERLRYLERQSNIGSPYESVYWGVWK